MANYDLEPLKVMIVDDNRHMRRLVKSILNALGVMNVAEAENGADAIKRLEDFEADFLIVDWSMSPMDGITFTHHVRNDDDSPNIYVPIIMLTGHTEAGRVMEARDAGVTEFLAKPISALQLFQRIRTIIEAPRQYVRTADYFGPDRRRRNELDYAGPERRRQRVEV